MRRYYRLAPDYKSVWDQARLLLLGLVFLFSAGCGYRPYIQEPIAISIPYVVGDFEQRLTSTLTAEAMRSPFFTCVSENRSRWSVQVDLGGVSDERIDFRFDQGNQSGFPIKRNLVGTENRQRITAYLTLKDLETGSTLLSRYPVMAETDYNYVNSSSLEDLSFVSLQEGGQRVSSLTVSLGQLDGVDQAKIDGYTPLYRNLAKNIVNTLVDYRHNHLEDHD